jgi:hypothetical protein
MRDAATSRRHLELFVDEMRMKREDEKSGEDEKIKGGLCLDPLHDGPPHRAHFATPSHTAKCKTTGCASSTAWNKVSGMTPLRNLELISSGR